MTRRILLVDDEPMILRIMKRALVKDGYVVDTAANGEDALDKIKKNCPDLMISDIEMPRMSGQALCEHLHQVMPNRAFPIFISTSLTALVHREWSQEIPGLTFLEKPISIRKLRAAIANIFDVDSSNVLARLQ